MKRVVVCLLCLLLCASCAPTGQDSVISIGTEDGGGSGYGIGTQSVLKLSDFYGITSGSVRDNNLLILGSPSYSLDGSDTYFLSDGSQVVLTYNDRGSLSETLYTEFSSGKSYDLLDYLISIGVLHGTIGDAPQTPTTPSTNTQGGSQQNTPTDMPLFSTKLYKKESIDGKLSLYADRSTVISTIGAPSSFGARQYKRDSYIIDLYNLDDGSVLMLDYGYDRKSLRGAAIKGADGTTSGYLGVWSAQSKPADFVRASVKLNQITSLSKGSTPAKVYAALGEPAWFEGSASNYQDVYLLSDGSYAYLSYSGAHSKLSGAYQITIEGKMVQVSLR